jgi:hypothetical protein
MPDETGPVVRSAADIRHLGAKFRTAGGAHWLKTTGGDGYITAAAGAKIAIFSRWVINHSGQNPDGTPRFRFKGQFRWANELMLEMVGRGTLKGRVIVQFKTTKGLENVDILGWDEWHYADGVLILENVYQTEGAKYRALDGQ